MKSIIDPIFDTEYDPRIPEVWSGDGEMRSNEQCREWANQCNCDVIEAQSNQLFLDLDTEESYIIFQEHCRFLKKHFYPFTLHIGPSKSGLPHRHVTVTFKQDLDIMTRIALQACLGSDPMRELISVRRAIDKEDNIVIFFEPKVTT